jgi:uncharacterized membrane protein
MKRIEESIFISRPCEEVFEYLATRANDPSWMVSVLESQWLDANDDPHAPSSTTVGRRGRMVMKIMGRLVEFTDEVTEYEPGRRIAHRTVEGTFPLSTACICSPAGDGCHATVVGEADRLVGGPLGHLIERFVAWSIRNGFRADLAKLKQILETERSTEH